MRVLCLRSAAGTTLHTSVSSIGSIARGIPHVKNDHTTGMWEVHRLEKRTPLPRWTAGVYVVCWLLLAAGAVLLAPRLW
jgi:hypothetical protein